jgi:hypothetical protein
MVGVLLNPNFPPAEGQLKDMQEAARALGLRMLAARAQQLAIRHRRRDCNLLSLILTLLAKPSRLRECFKA